MLEKPFPVGRPSRDGNNDNRANSAQVQMILPTRAEIGNIEIFPNGGKKTEACCIFIKYSTSINYKL
jgi:hypothetical protein